MQIPSFDVVGHGLADWVAVVAPAEVPQAKMAPKRAMAQAMALTIWTLRMASFMSDWLSPKGGTLPAADDLQEDGG
jgi:hypothetical protein